MFKKLRNKLILINLGITSVVILTVFAFIYGNAIRSANDRPPMPEQRVELYSDDVENVIRISIENEKQAAAQNLLVTLIVSGVAIELIVAFVSYFLAEEAIKPVREAYEAQKVFIANASHEIKTPLAAITANLEAADIRDNKWISNVEKEATKLTTLNNELLKLARTDLVKDIKLEEVDLAKILNDVIETHVPRMKNLNFTKKIVLPRKIKINREDFVQVVNILLDNAIKYSDSKIILTAEQNILSIKNDGARISEKDLPHIFERFYQVDKSADGVGLGLSIAKAVAERNGWTLEAKSGKMTTFTLEF